MAAPVSQMITANRLVDGDVVYWHAGGWVEALGEADVFAADTEAKTALAEVQKSMAANLVVNPYLFDVREERGGIMPVKERELIRAAGPTVRGDLGKQAEGLTPSNVRRAAAEHDVANPALALSGSKAKDNDESI